MAEGLNKETELFDSTIDVVDSNTGLRGGGVARRGR